MCECVYTLTHNILSPFKKVILSHVLLFIAIVHIVHSQFGKMASKLFMFLVFVATRSELSLSSKCVLFVLRMLSCV